MTESFDPSCFERLNELNRIISTTGEKVEGNLFYKHEDADFPNATLLANFQQKRANMRTACIGRGRLLEIGTNGAHTALWLLHHNPHLHYTGVDIGKYRYTQKAIDFLKQTFPGRVEYHMGDSIDVLGKLIKEEPIRFDIVHIDGAHDSHHVAQDFMLSGKLCVPFAWMVFNDVHFPNIAEFYTRQIAEKTLLKKEPEGWVEDRYHAIGMLPE